MAELDRTHLSMARTLGEDHAAAVLLAGAVLKELYRTLRLGGGVFRPRGMAKEVEAQTLVELWTYVAALLVSMGEKWPASPQLFGLTFFGSVLLKILGIAAEGPARSGLTLPSRRAAEASWFLCLP